MTLAAVLVFGLLRSAGAFTIDGTAVHTVELNLPIDSVRAMVHDLSVLERHMPGVVDIGPHPAGGYWYRTEREIPFSGTMKTDFHIVGMEQDDGGVTFRTPGTEAGNWMSFRFSLRPLSPATTLLTMRLRVRLVRDVATDIHVLAPVLGEGFLSNQMERDLAAMLEIFARRVSQRTPGPPQTGLAHEE